MNKLHNPQCRDRHLGDWCIKISEFMLMVDAVRNGTMRANQPESDEAQSARRGREGSDLISPAGEGVVVIPISGTMIKGGSKFGGTADTIEIRQAIRTAARDDSIRGIMIQADSPGGTVAGTDDLSADIRRAGELKTLHTHIEDLGASALVWATAHSKVITANSTALVGSIGVVAVVEDSSKAAGDAGIVVHVVSTGEHKGDFIPGTEVTEEQIAALQDRIDDLNGHFMKAVSDGRGLTMAEVRKIADGRVHIASKAKGIGLIDAVSDMDTALAKLHKETRRRRKRSAAARIRQVELG